MSKYELWAKRKDESTYKKICEFEERCEIDSRIDEILATGEYFDATVLLNHRYITGREYKKPKTKRK